MVRFMFAHQFACAAEVLNAFHGITFASDRGYWTPALILFLLGLGVWIFGTVMRRAELSPFTFDQQLKSGDKRVKIDKQYGRNVFIAFARWGAEMVKGLLWRGGTGACLLAVSSNCNENEPQVFDFNFANNGNARW